MNVKQLIAALSQFDPEIAGVFRVPLDEDWGGVSRNLEPCAWKCNKTPQ